MIPCAAARLGRKAAFRGESRKAAWLRGLRPALQVALQFYGDSGERENGKIEPARDRAEVAERSSHGSRAAACGVVAPD